MKFKSKTLLIDNDEDTNFKDEIRPCNFNYARMTPLELMYCKVFMWKSIQRNIKGSFEELIEGLKQFLWQLFNFLTIPFLPIMLYIYTVKEIKHAKNEVWKNQCFECKYWKSSPRTGQDMTVTVGDCDKCKIIDGVATRFIKSL